MADQIRPSSSKVRRVERDLKPKPSKEIAFMFQKRKSKTRIVSPIGSSKQTPESSRSPLFRPSKETPSRVPSRQESPNYSSLLSKYLESAFKEASSRKNSPHVFERKDTKSSASSRIEPRSVHKRVRSDLSKVNLEQAALSPHAGFAKKDILTPSSMLQEQPSSRKLSLDMISKALLDSSQEETMKRSHKRNNSEVNSAILNAPSSNRSLGNSFEKHEQSKKEAEEREREGLIQNIILNFRKKGLPPPTSVDFYRFGKQLGKGAFGKVYLGLHRLTGLKVAIKTIDKSFIKDERTRKKVFQEVFVMKRVQHQNVIRLFEVFESTRHLMIVLEYSGGGDLLQLVKTRGRLPESEAKSIFGQVVDGVEACHNRNVIHRDIKLDNILLTTDFNCIKICDFGVSRVVKPGEKINEQCGTPAYLAPEIIADRGYEPFYVDIWSMGVLLYAMVCGTVPFKAKTLPDLHKLILRCKYHMPSNLSVEIQDLIRRMLNPIPHQRIPLAEIKMHP